MPFCDKKKLSLTPVILSESDNDVVVKVRSFNIDASLKFKSICDDDD